MYRNYISVLALIFLLSACASAPNAPLQSISMLESVRNQIKSTRVIVGLDPENSINFIPQHQLCNTNQQYGLLGAIIGSLIVNSLNSGIQNQERLMTPIRSAAIKFNFGSKFRENFEKNIKPISWLNIRSVSKAPHFQRFKSTSLLEETDASAVLVADSFYTMSADFSKITITSHVILYPNNPVLLGIAKQQIKDGKEPVLFQQTFTYEHAYEGVYLESENAAKGWASDNGAMIYRALDSGVTEIAKNIGQNLKQTWTIVASTDKKINTITDPLCARCYITKRSYTICFLHIESV